MQGALSYPYLLSTTAHYIYSGVIAEKASADLFIADTTGDTAIQKAHKTNKPLRADEILAQRSAVPAVDTRKRKSNVTDGIIEARNKKSKSTYVKPRELERLRNIAYGGEKIRKHVISTDERPNYDPWTAQEIIHDPQLSFLDNHEPKPVQEPKTIRHAPLSLATNGKAFPAVRKPDPGRSYNPDFNDWSSLLEREGAKEVTAETERRAAAAIEAERLARAQAIAAEPDPETEVEDSAWESEWEGIHSEVEDADLLKQKRPERKTQAQRNKERRKKEEERALIHERKLREKEKQVERVKQLAREMSEKDKMNRNMVKVEEQPGFNEDDEDVELHKRRKFGNAK